jgi:murein DD-endopeptidase MepM/ murein hydrolase activator NlpD
MWGAGKCAPTNLGPIGTGSYVWPSTERRVSGYEWTPDVGHYGIDIGGDTGNPIYAVDNGVVVYSGWNDWGYGNVIAIDHGNGIQTIYAHMDTLSVACGAFVYQGDIIGTMGSTGNSSGPHLHIEFRSGNTPQNPHNFIGY